MDNTLLNKQLEKKEYITKAQRERLLNVFLIMIKELEERGVLMFSLTWCSKDEGQIVEEMDMPPTETQPDDAWAYVMSGGILNEMVTLLGIDGADFAYFTIVEEERDATYPRVYCLFGVRSFFGKNEDGLALAISKYLDNPWMNFKFLKTKPLYTYEEKKEFATFLFKDIQTNLPWHGLSNYSQTNKEIYTPFFDMITLNNLPYYDMSGRTIYYVEGVKHNIKGYIPHNLKKKHFHDASMLVYLWSLYLSLNNMIVDRDLIYKKIPNTKYSYEYIGTIDWLSENCLSIIKHLKSSIRFQLDYINQLSFISSNNKKAVNIVKENVKLLSQKQIRWDLIEFNDGIYHIKYNRFTPYDVIGSKLDNIDLCIGRFIPCSYRVTSSLAEQNFPWIDILNKSLDKKQVDMLCRSLGSMFMMNPTINKNTSQRHSTINLFDARITHISYINDIVEGLRENTLAYKEQLLYVLHRSMGDTAKDYSLKTLYQSCLPILLVGKSDNYKSLIKSEAFDALYLLKYINNNSMDTKNKEAYIQIHEGLPIILIYCIDKWHKHYGIALNNEEVNKLFDDITLIGYNNI